MERSIEMLDTTIMQKVAFESLMLEEGYACIFHAGRRCNKLMEGGEGKFRT